MHCPSTAVSGPAQGNRTQATPVIHEAYITADRGNKGNKVVAVSKYTDLGYFVRLGSNRNHMKAQHTEESLDTAQHC